MTEESFQEKFEKVVIGIEKAGYDYAEKKAQSWQMQELRKVVLAKEMSKCDVKSSVEKERLALVSEEYQNHILGTSQAIHEELKAKAKCEKLSNQFEAYRSLCSLEKKQMNIL